MTQVTLRTGAWYGDRAIDIFFPDHWELNIAWPRTPQPLSTTDAIANLEHPINQEPLRKMCIGMRTMITLHVNADRQVVGMHCGDHFSYYKDAVAFCRAAYSVEPPEGADVVVSNTYPNDVSLTFARMKGMAPLHAWAPPRATRIAVAASSEGMGRHDLFPLASFPDAVWLQAMARRASVMRIREVRTKLTRRVVRYLRPRTPASTQRPPIWLYRTGSSEAPLHRLGPGMRSGCSWDCILQSVAREQGNNKRLKVFAYPCAPLQFLA